MAHLVLTRLALWSNEFTRETDIHTHTQAQKTKAGKEIQLRQKYIRWCWREEER